MVQEKIYNKIKITIVKDYEEMSQLAARILLKKISSNSNINLLVPTGATPKKLYEVIRKKPRKIFRKVKFFNMDEYCKNKLVSMNNPVSFRGYMKNNLFKYICPVKNYFPSIKNAKRQGRYDKKIKRLGGIDFCINALGIDGQTFGFNFPGASFNSITRLVKINKLTRKVNKEKTGYETPKYAVTTGLKTGMESKEVLFLVSGKQKADILSKVVYSKKPTTKLPATILKLHPNCRWIVDKEAASKL